MRAKYLVAGCGVAGLAVFLTAGAAQDKKPASKAPAASAQRETVAKPLSEREKRRREERLRRELETPYRRWLNEDVTYIITDEERAAFRRLATDEEREQFIEQFWLRRDPTPDSAENEYKEEHYRRIAYANERYASGIPGWKTDRGRMYITFGPADEVESHPSGGSYERPIEEGGGTTSTFPFEKWRYRYIDGIGTDIIIEFVDPTMTGEYRMTMDPSEKDALLMVPNAGLTLYEQMGLTSKADRFNRTDGTRLGVGDQPLPMRMNQFERLEQYAKLQRPPSIKFKDLEAMVTTRITYNLLPIKVRADFIKITESTVMSNITVQLDNKDLQFQQRDGLQRATVNMYGRITSMSRRVVSVFEEPVVVETPAEMLEASVKRSSIYQHKIPLAPGTYRLNVVVKDVVGGSTNNYELALHVPRFDEEKLAASSLILADLIEKVPTRSIGTGQFVIGGSKVRPRITDTFRRDERMGIYVQLYNFGPDDKTQKPNGTIEYEVVRNGTNEQVFAYTEEVTAVPDASAQQVTVEKLLPLQSLEPGQYTLKLKVTDKNRNQVLTPRATFTIT
ncbi:MAG: GWxTD domain-containing protein [Acidobacteria bacterium]|nr:GWxTD domain-containing protein [Acidobacteriota bacterium]